MTAPDLEGIIAAALHEHWRAHVDIAGDDIRYVCECGAVELVEGSGHSSTTTWSRAHQARAVLAAISEAGAVEWGVAWAYLSEMYPERTDRKESQQTAQASLDKSFANGVVVSRITGPWTAVEG